MLQISTYLRFIQDVAFTLGTPDSIGHRESAVASGCKRHRYFKSKWNKTSNENSMLDIFQSAQRGRCDFGLRLPVGKRWENCLRCVLRPASYRRCCVKLLRCSSCFAESIVGISRCRPWPSVLAMAENINMDEQTDCQTSVSMFQSLLTFGGPRTMLLVQRCR